MEVFHLSHQGSRPKLICVATATRSLVINSVSGIVISRLVRSIAAQGFFVDYLALATWKTFNTIIQTPGSCIRATSRLVDINLRLSTSDASFA